MSEGTRAPWATKVVNPVSGAAPGAGASVTRAPWAVAGGAGGGGGGAMEGSRAPWAQGVSVPGGVQPERMDFEAVAKQNPAYTASLAAAAATPAASASASAAVSSASAAAAAPSSSVPLQHYSAPVKVIKTPNYLPLWKRTRAYHELTSFILLLNDKVRGVKVAPEGMPSKKYAVSAKVKLISDWLQESKRAIASIPPIQQSMRYGNKAFRTWHEQQTSVSSLQPMLHALLGEDLVSRGADVELLAYLQDSFGSLQRIDYGTGHELNFVLFMCAVNKLGVFTPDDHVALVLELFRQYILLMEELQSVYWLEPAGSKGAWGLDDYQFLVFLWGSSQLLGSTVQPSDILKEAVVESHSAQYLFLLGIKFIHRMKSGPFHEHSAFLHQISELPSWQKANSGLVKMYDEEVLNKHPIVQHILFGRILQFAEQKPGDELGVTAAIKQWQEKNAAKPPVPLFSAAATTEAAASESSSGSSEANPAAAAAL